MSNILAEDIEVTGVCCYFVDFGSNDNTVCSPIASTVGYIREQSPKLTARQQTIAELFQTEKNYVGILHTILKVLSVCYVACQHHSCLAAA